MWLQQSLNLTAFGHMQVLEACRVLEYDMSPEVATALAAKGNAAS